MDIQAPVLPTTNVYPAQQAQLASGLSVHRTIPLQNRGLTALEPILHLEHAGPTTFGPSTVNRSLGVQPARGYEIVTLVYQGDLQHRNSLNKQGALNTGDAHWLTAGTGLMHDQTFGHTLKQQGGVLELIQLSLNVPALHKHVAPHHQHLVAEVFPVVPLTGDGSNFVRLIAGHWQGYHGPAKTYSPLTLADLYLEANAETIISLDSSWHTSIYVMEGGVEVNKQSVAARMLATVRDEREVKIHALAPTHLLFISAAPLGEPIATSGPIVMNTTDEVKLAQQDLAAGRFGSL